MTTITHAGKFNTGDRIRAYEFEPMMGRNDCYHEGTVVEANCRTPGYPCYLLRVTRHVFDGQPVSFPAALEVFVPHEVHFREYAHRVIPV